MIFLFNNNNRYRIKVIQTNKLAIVNSWNFSLYKIKSISIYKLNYTIIENCNNKRKEIYS